MNDVRCRGCGGRRDREDCIRYGFGWCCDRACRRVADERAREAKTEERPLLTKGRQNRSETSPQHVGKTRARPLLTKTRTEPSTQCKEQVRERDGHVCRRCGTPRELHVHHIILRAQGGGHNKWNLVTLCLRCHALVHENTRYWQPILLFMVSSETWLNVIQASHILEVDYAGELPPGPYSDHPSGRRFMGEP